MATAICSLLIAPLFLGGCGGPRKTPGSVSESSAVASHKSDEGAARDNPQDIVVAARALATAGDPAGALASLENGLERFPNDGDLHAELGTYLISDGLPDEGRRHLEAAMKTKGDAARRAHRTLADALFKQKAYDEAVDLLDSYRVRHPGDFSVDMQAAWIHFDREHYDSAVACYQSAVHARPKSVDARVGLAKAYEKLNRNDSAIRAFDKAIKLHGLDPLIAPVVLAQANLLTKTGRPDKALALVESCQNVFRLTAGLECALGMALSGEGRYDDAIEAFVRATGNAQYMDFAYEQIRRIEQLRRQSR